MKRIKTTLGDIIIRIRANYNPENSVKYSPEPIRPVGVSEKPKDTDSFKSYLSDKLGNALRVISRDIVGNSPEDMKREGIDINSFPFIASLYMKLGRQDEAWDIARRLPRMSLAKFSSYSEITSALAEEMTCDEAEIQLEATLKDLTKGEPEKTGRRMADSSRHALEANMYLRIASFRAKKRDFDEALKAADRIITMALFEAYFKIAVAQAEAGLIDEAEKTITYIRDKKYFSRTYAHIALAQAKAEKPYEQISETCNLALSLASDEETNAYILPLIASAHLAAKRDDGVSYVSEEVYSSFHNDNNHYVPTTFARISAVYAEGEKIDYELTDRLLFRYHRIKPDDTLTPFETASIQNNSKLSNKADMAAVLLRLAFQNARYIKDPASKALAYSEIASTQAKSGVRDEARKTFGMALDMLEGQTFRAHNYLQIASAQAAVGMYDEARETIESTLRLAQKHVDVKHPKIALKNKAEIYPEIAHYCHDMLQTLKAA